ncbi:unnamed protein product [Adineta steineri]|uniref:TRPM SLOG domain-containing protein n=1 Tax=Adineta steineri TaxID=433720 RepID=A0A814UHQ3_9BILA|nr:unnamed protein product [Adineta steineri]CAF1175016.1 unnamed protein product [Adineta steineri]
MIELVGTTLQTDAMDSDVPCIGFCNWKRISVFRNTVPIVTLLLGGNITTLVVICEGLQNETPVVAVLGTGHLADIVAALCYDLRSYHELTHKQFNDYPDLKKKLEEKKEKDIQECKLRLKELGRLEGKNTDQIDDKIKKCVKILEDMNTLIAVYDGVKCIDNLEDVIADAMWNEISYHRKNKETRNDGYDPRAEELKWCLIWNKEARGELEIWINSGDENLALAETKRRWVSKLGQSALFEALCRNKVSFVNLLMDNGASIEAFEINDLQIICKKAMNDDALPLDWPPRHLHASNDPTKLLENMHNSYLIQYLGYYVIIRAQLGYNNIISTWNWEDLAAVTFYLVGFITRFFVIETVFIVSKIFMAIDLIIWSFRVLHLFTAYEILGPKLVMIYKMMKDAVLIFVFFILILLFSFSVTSWSLLTTSNQVNWTYAGDGSLYNVTVMNGGSDLWTWQLLRDVSNWGIWKVFGQTDEPYNGVVSGNDVYGTFVYLLAIAFVLISNILLVNVLIAMFNVTIQRILDRSRIIWRHQRFLLIYEYSERPVLPAPLNVCYYPVKFIIYLWRLCCCERPCVSSRVTQSTD